MDKEKWYDGLWADIYTIILDTEHTDQIQELVKEKVKQVVKEFAENLKYEISNSCAHIELDKVASIPIYVIKEKAIYQTIDELVNEVVNNGK